MLHMQCIPSLTETYIIIFPVWHDKLVNDIVPCSVPNLISDWLTKVNVSVRPSIYFCMDE